MFCIFFMFLQKFLSRQSDWFEPLLSRVTTLWIMLVVNNVFIAAAALCHTAMSSMCPLSRCCRNSNRLGWGALPIMVCSIHLFCAFAWCPLCSSSALGMCCWGHSYTFPVRGPTPCQWTWYGTPPEDGLLVPWGREWLISILFLWRRLKLPNTFLKSLNGFQYLAGWVGLSQRKQSWLTWQ